jgi:hypothetical protein
VPSLAVPTLCRERETMLALEVSAAVDQVFGIEPQQVTVLIQKKQGKRTEIVYQILSSGFRGWPHAINYPQLGFAQFDANKIWNLHISII